MATTRLSSSSTSGEKNSKVSDQTAFLPSTLGTVGNPATSALQIYNAGIRTSGLYYINLPTVGSTQVYCDMTTNGGGWMLAMKLDSTLGTGTVRHYYDPTWWEGASYGLAPANPRTNGELKTAVYPYYPHSEVMLEYGYGSSYFQNTAIACYTQPVGGNPGQIDKTMVAKMGSGGFHANGGFTVNGYTTQQNRWKKTFCTDHDFFPNAYLHINVSTHSPGNVLHGGNDIFRMWFNAVPDISTDGVTCNQVGGFGMTGDSNQSVGTSNVGVSTTYTQCNASGTISPPVAWGNITDSCQWNGIKAHAGTSGANYAGLSGTTPIGSSYYNNGVALIWVR